MQVLRVEKDGWDRFGQMVAYNGTLYRVRLPLGTSKWTLESFRDYTLVELGRDFRIAWDAMEYAEAVIKSDEIRQGEKNDEADIY